MQEFLKNIAQNGKKIANKNLGQNFLTSEEIIHKIVNSCVENNSDVIEIGTGLGSLTFAILERTQNFIGIEKDTDLANLLQQKFPHGKFVNADALKFDFQTVITPQTVIVSNLPYNIGTRLVIKLGIEILPDIKSMTIMLQKDVIAKITGKFGSEHYHQLGVFFQSFCTVEHVCDAPSSAFSPAPNVVSSVVKITPQKHNIELPKFWDFLQEIFRFRRKMMGSIFKEYKGSYKEKRSDELQPEQLLKTFRELENIF